MRAPKTTLLLVALTLWAGQSHAQSSQQAQPAERLQPAQTSQPTQSSESSQPAQATPLRYSADALYNLANSYARDGKPGLAVLNYERAALLAPNDPDITANLDYVRTTAHVPLEPRTRLTRIALVANPTQAAWIGVLGLALFGAGLLAKRIPPRLRWIRAVSALIGSALIALPVANATLLWPRLHAAVVLTDQTPARVSPVLLGDTAFILPEAETVTITAQHEDFTLIRTRTGQTGWVARANLGAVVP